LECPLRKTVPPSGMKGDTDGRRNCVDVDSRSSCRDWLLRDAARPDRFLHLRRWASVEMRSEAQIDPEVHRYWQRLPDLCNIPVVYENLESVFES